MADPLLDRYRTIRCPAGSRPELDLDANDVGCFTETGERVPELSATRLGVVGWAAVIGGAMAAVAALIRWRT